MDLPQWVRVVLSSRPGENVLELLEDWHPAVNHIKRSSGSNMADVKMICSTVLGDRSGRLAPRVDTDKAADLLTDKSEVSSLV